MHIKLSFQNDQPAVEIVGTNHLGRVELAKILHGLASGKFFHPVLEALAPMLSSDDQKILGNMVIANVASSLTNHKQVETNAFFTPIVSKIINDE